MFSGWTPRYGGSTGYPTPPPADPGLQSFRDQHLAQLEQLQKMHQRQMESVLPVGAPGSAPAPTPASVPPRPYYPPRQSYPYPPPYSHNVPPPGYQSPALPPDTEKPPPPPPATDQQPPPPPPDSAPSSNNAALEDQQQYWYNQHLLNLQQKAKSHGREAPPPVFETVVPPSAGYVAAPPSQQPPPPPVEEAKPPLPVENVASGINLTEDPEQAQRLKTLQEAAAHWQQHEQHRLGFQYQGIMQKHSAMQQLLQRYQQIVQEPPHLAAMTVDVQLQHYEMQQKQLVPLYQEWENQFKKWQELLQTYPHKDQLQEYQVQWASWQTHIKSTKTHLKDKIASLKSLKQQFGGSHYIGGIAMVPQYPTYSPVMSPAVPTALPTGVSIQPPYTAPVAPVYGPGPPPSLPPATTYSEATPPLPPVTAPPLPPSSSAPPPPPPVSSPSADVLQPPQPPLPPATDTQPPPPVGASAPEPETTLSVPMAASSTSDSTPAAITSSSVMSSAPSTMPPAATDPPVPAGSFIPGNQTLSSGLSYQAQQTMKNVKPPLGQSAPPVPSHNLPSEFPSGLDKQSEHTKFSNPPGLPPVPDQELTPTVPPTPPSMMAGGPYEGPRESRFPAQGHGFAPPHFPPPGSLGFHGYHPTHDKENQHWTNENKDQSTPADPSKQYLETSDHMVPANKWDRPKDNPNQSWERPKPPHVSETEAKEMSDYPPGPVSDRESNYPAEMWNRPDGPQFNKRGSQGDNMGNKWDQPPESRWSTSNEQSSDRRSNFQDRWGVENSTPMDRFGNTQSSGPNRFGGPEVAPYERYGDGMGPPYDQHGAPEIPFQDRFGHPDGSQRFRYNAPDLQARGRARFPSMPPRGRFPFPESHPRHRFGAPEGRPSSFGYPETFSRDHFGGPELPSQDHMGGPEQPLVRDHFGNSEQPPPQEGFRGSEQPPSQERFESPEVSSYQEGFRDPKMPPPRHQFGGSDIPTPQDQFGGPELPQSHNRFGGPDVPDWRKGPGMPPPPVDRFKGSGMPPPPGDRFKGPGMPPPPADRFKGPGMPPPSADRFKGPGMPPAPGDHFRGPGMPPPGDRFRGPETSPHPEDRFRGPEMPPHLGDRFRGSEMPPPPGDRFKGSEMPLTPEDRFKGPEVSPAPGNRFKGPEVSPAPGNRFKGPEVKPATGDNFKGPEMPLPSGDNFRDSEIPPPSGDRFKGPEMPPPAGDPFKGPAMLPSPGDRFGTPEMSSSQQQKRFGDFDGPRRDNWSHADKDNFGAADIPLHDNRDNRVPFSDRWGSGDRKGRPDWPRGRGDGGNRPPLLGDSPLEKSEIQGSTSNVPTKSYQSQFKKHIFKETDVSLSADSFPGDQKDSKKEQQDVEMKQVDEPPKDGAPKKADGSAVQDASKTETSPPSEMHKPVEAADTNKDKTKASDLPKTDPSGDQTLPDLSKVNEPLSASSVHSDASKGTGQIGNTSTSDKREIDLPGLSKPIVTQTSAPEAAKSNVPVPTLSMASKPEEPTDSSRSLGKQDAFQISFPSRSGGLLPTPTTGIVGPFPPYATPPFRPQAPHSMPPVRPGDPWAPPVRAVDPWAAPVRPTGPRGAPIRPGGPRAAPPIRPGGPRAAPPIRPGGPRAAPPIRPGGPRAAFPVRPGGPRADLPIRPGGPRAAPPVRPGGPRGAPPVRMGGPRAPPPVRMGGPRAGHPIRPGAPGGPFSAWEDPLERMDQGEDSEIYDPSRGADPMCEDPYNEEDEEAVMGENYSHGPEGRHGRPEFPEEEDDDAGGYFHNEPGRPGGFREDDASFEPEPFAQDWPENYDVRFDHRGRGRARGFMRGRPPPRPGSREVMDDLDDRGFEPRGHLPEERPSFREGLNEPPPFGREPFPREPRFPDRERFSADPPLEARRRDFALEEGRLDDWERERFWRARELDNLRDPFLDIYMRDERLPLRPPHLPHDIDVRLDPWYDRYLDRDLDRVINHNRLERPYVFELDLDRDFSRIPEDLDLPLRDRERLSARRPLSPHRPYSPVRARSPLPPLPPIERYLDDRWRLDRELSDRDFRDRGELRIREYPERPLWHDDRNPDLLPERSELELKDGRWYPREGRVSEGPNPLEPQLPVDSASGALPEQPGLPGGEPGATGVLALSQRQHEIILKAAQELKMLREQKEQLDNLKNFFGDPEPSNSTGKMAAVQASGKLQQPLPNVPVTGMDPASSTLAASVGGRAIGDQFSDLWEEERRGGHSAGLPVGSKLSGIHQTVDYAHGRELAIGKVEQTPYGERVMLLPEPAMDRGGIPPFQKDFLIDSFDRDFRDRDPYYERMKSADRRDYDRDRLDRDRADHERDRDRHSRDDRSSYRDKDGSSRRSTSDKPPYDRKVDRPGYEVAPPSYGGRGRNFPEERPVIPPPLPVPPPEKKPETKNVDDLLKKPGRESRPDRIVVIMRGLPGSGKTHVAKLIRDKEVEYGGSAPRVLSLDDYFITEVEKVEKDPESGKKIKTKVMDYEYEPEMEETYRSGMLKTFKKTLDDGFFPFIILDSIHDRVRHFEQFWSAAKTKGFEVYLAEITVDTQICGKRNVHGRKLKDINKMFDNWEPAPRHMIRLDIRSLLQDAAIEEVEMEDSEPSVEPQKDEKKEAAEEDDNDRGYLPKSKWEMDTSEAKLDKLDGLKVNKRKRDYESVASRMEDYLQLPDDYDTRESEPGKKRVRWADLEEKKDADRKRAIGFVVGQTDWDKITDKSGHLAERALNRTKYI